MEQETVDTKEQMKFIVYQLKNTSKKELLNSERYIAHQKIPNSKMLMYFFKTEKTLLNEEQVEYLEKGNMQLYLDEKRKYIFAETTELSEATHQLLFEGYEVIGELEIPGEKQANEQFVKKMLTNIRSFTHKKA